MNRRELQSLKARLEMRIRTARAGCNKPDPPTMQDLVTLIEAITEDRHRCPHCDEPAPVHIVGCSRTGPQSSVVSLELKDD